MERNAIDARGARLAIRTYLRWAWVPLVAIAVGYVVGGALSREEPGAVSSSATFVVGLTEEVRWPFFDAVLARQEGLIEDRALADAASTATGVEWNTVEVASTNVQNSTLTIEPQVNSNDNLTISTPVELTR